MLKKLQTFGAAEQVSRLKRRTPHVLYLIFRTLFFIGMAYVVLYPVLVMVSRAFRVPSDMLNPTIVWLPQHFTLENFSLASDIMEFPKTAWLTGRIAIICTILTMASCSMAGYALGRYNMKGKLLLTVLAVLTIVVPVQSYLIAIFLKFRYFDFFGIGSIIGWFTGTPLTVQLNQSEFSFYLMAFLGMGIRSGLFILLFSQFFKGMPKELEDAARIDGCSEAGVFIKVMLPNAGSPYLVTLILSLVWYWNDTTYGAIMFQGHPLLANQVNNVGKLAEASFMFWQQHGIEPDGLSETVVYFAAALLFIVPPLLIYLVAQKFFMQSVERSGIVG